jgi:epidermal growth factor receptor substrate 15
LFPSAQNTGSNIFSAQPAVSKPETSQSTDDDFDDDAFRDLADAKEDDTKDNDNDFNIVDRPSDAFDFESVFEATPQTTGRSHRTGLSDEFDFGFDIADQKAAPVQQPTMSGSSQAAPPSQDWDAIFSGLQNPIQQQPSGTTTEQPKELQPSALEGSALARTQTNGSNSAAAFENNNANNNANAGENKSAGQSEMTH